MLTLKEKLIIRIRVILTSLALVSALLVPLLSVGQVSAAAALCDAHKLGGGVGPCDSAIPVTTGGFAQPDKCYTLDIDSNKKFVYTPEPTCNEPPFNVPKSITSNGQCKNLAGVVGACSNGIKVQGTGKLTAVGKCYNEGVNKAKVHYYAITGCTNPPFKAPLKVECVNGTVAGDPGDNANDLCAKLGGTKAGKTPDPKKTPETDIVLTPDPAATCAAASTTCHKAIFSKFINPFIKFLSAGVGVIVVIMIVIGGMRYSSAGSDPQKVAAARSMIVNALIALVAYIFMFAFLEWVIPGGLGI